MAAHPPEPVLGSTSNSIGLPDEIIGNILLQCSTPTFIQLIRTSKEFYNSAVQRRKVLLHHLNQVPGDKVNLDDPKRNNVALLLILRQRAANNLYGSHLTANMTEHLARYSDLDPTASSIGGLDADYVRIALVHKHNTDIRQYTSHCAMKEKIKQPPGVKLLRLVQWSRFISVLCAWEKEKVEDFSEDSETDSSDSESEVLVKTPFPPSANTRLRLQRGDQGDSKIGRRRKPGPSSTNKYNYRVCHYDVYTLDESQTFAVDGYLDYVPRDFAVYSCLQCAILWDVDNVSGRPTEDATVINYTATESQQFYAAKYESRTVWPSDHKPSRRDNDSDDEDSPEYLPERIEFFREGKRIKMYDAGGIVPYEIFSTSSTIHEPFSQTNAISFDNNISFHIDTPFYGTHVTCRDEEAHQTFCFQTHLCLGVATLDVSEDQDDEKEVRVLCILRSQSKLYPENCEHRISLQRMAHVSANNSTVVARLWGWEEIHSNLTGKEIVAISSGGTRIAIALWNKVLIYPLNPRVLCDEVVVDSSEDESPKSKKKKKKKPKQWQTAATGYYKRNKDKHLLEWKVAELRPIIIDLEGAIAHKMNWSPPKGIITDTIDVSIADSSVAKEALPDNENATVEIPGSDNPTEDAVDAAVATQSSEPEVAETQAIVPPTESSPTQQLMSQSVSAEDTTNSAIEPTASTSESIADSQALDNNQGVSEPNHGDNYQTAQSSTEDIKADLQEQLPTPAPSPSTPATLDTPAETNVPTPPSMSLNPLYSALPQAPYGSIPSIHSSQTSKPSARKKDKGSEVGNGEIVSPFGSEKDKTQSGYSVTAPLKQKSNVELPSPSSPEMNKNLASVKPKETVSQALSIVQTPLTPPVDLVPNEEHKMSTTAPPSSIPAGTHLGDMPSSSECLPQTHVPNFESKSDEQQNTNDLSKIAESESLEVERHEAAESTHDNEHEIVSRRRKRISEDELVILTDRGIQVWNIGAKAKGVRKKRNIPMEERLAGKLPRSKQKGTEIYGNDGAEE